MKTKRTLTRSVLLMLMACLATSVTWASYTQFYAGYCTYYAAQRFDGTAPAPQCNWNGDAQNWLTNANAAGWQTTTTSSSPANGAVVVWSGGGYGHVAYVESCASNGINIAEMNFGPTTKGHGPNGPNETDAQFQNRKVNAITDNWNIVTSTFLSFSSLSSRGSLSFVGYVLPALKGQSTPQPQTGNPTGSITSPSQDGTLVRRPITITGTAVDNGSPVSSITLAFDGTTFAIVNPPTANWSVPFSPVGRPRGAHTITLTVSDQQGLSRSYTRTVKLPFVTAGDYFGDGTTDFAVFRPSTGMWYMYQPITGAQNAFGGLGNPGDIPVPGDYDGDGKADYAFYRPSEGAFYAYCTSGRQLHTVLGQQGDIPVPADYFGDGTTDFAVFRPSTGYWYVYQPITGAQKSLGLGNPGDIPVPGDYDGDGKADYAFYRPSEGAFYAYCTSGRQLHTVLGQQGDIPVPADYFGDGVTDFSVFRPSTGMWYMYQPITGAQNAFGGLGNPGDIPVPGDYDGDGKADYAFYRPSEGAFYAYCTSGRQLHTVLGQPGDIPITYMLGPEGL